MNIENSKSLKHYLKSRISMLNKSKDTPENCIKYNAAVDLLNHLNSIKK